MLEGSAKPVGGDTEAVVRLADREKDDKGEDARASAPVAPPGETETPAPVAS